jgi:para-aminobenzoate synthetase component I
VKKSTAVFSIQDPKEFKWKMLNWVRRFNIFCLLDNNDYHFEQPSFDCLLAAGSRHAVSLPQEDLFNSLRKFHDEYPEWIFGHINYPSSTPDAVGFPPGFFFQPQVLIRLTGNSLQIESNDEDAQSVFLEIFKQETPAQINDGGSFDVKARFSREEYIAIIRQLQQHIQLGDCYEINFCQEYNASPVIVDPFHVYELLTAKSPNPFAAFYRLNNKFCLCASPERFLKKEGNKIISQPIKGTAKRDYSSPIADDKLKHGLRESQKEKSENVMVVDLVRNDLSRFCNEGSVKVTELFGIYSFPQVHQMISTIEGEANENMHWTNIIENCFPMGSMTGAPKVKVMELIERYEKFPRGLFSGTIGYVTPDFDFDFNVVIRSLFYNESKRHVSIKAGSGITIYSQPEKEFEECELKAAALLGLLKN